MKAVFIIVLFVVTSSQQVPYFFGHYIPSPLNNDATCCIPNAITVAYSPATNATNTTNTTDAMYFINYNYASSVINNTWCQLANITGPFFDQVDANNVGSAYLSDMGNLQHTFQWSIGLQDIEITLTTNATNNCSFIANLQQPTSTPWAGTYYPTSGNSASSCCIPNSIASKFWTSSYNQLSDDQYLITYDYTSDSGAVNNAWCNAAGIVASTGASLANSANGSAPFLATNSTSLVDNSNSSHVYTWSVINSTIINIVLTSANFSSSTTGGISCSFNVSTTPTANKGLKMIELGVFAVFAGFSVMIV